MGRDRVPPLRDQRFCQSYAAGTCFNQRFPRGRIHSTLTFAAYRWLRVSTSEPQTPRRRQTKSAPQLAARRRAPAMAHWSTTCIDQQEKPATVVGCGLFLLRFVGLYLIRSLALSASFWVAFAAAWVPACAALATCGLRPAATPRPNEAAASTAGPMVRLANPAAF